MTRTRMVIVLERKIVDGLLVTIEKGKAVFHQFGTDYEEFETGGVSYSTAIIEWPNGTVDMVRADRIRFVEG